MYAGRRRCCRSWKRSAQASTRPIVAAGGIGSGRAMAAALRAGADAVRIGTRLVATTEADVHPAYADALVDASDDDTVLTETFATGWPNAPHVCCAACVEASTDDPASCSPLPPTRMFIGDVATAAMYAGTSVSDVRTVESATTVVRGLLRDAETAMAEENI